MGQMKQHQTGWGESSSGFFFSSSKYLCFDKGQNLLFLSCDDSSKMITIKCLRQISNYFIKHLSIFSFILEFQSYRGDMGGEFRNLVTQTILSDYLSWFFKKVSRLILFFYSDFITFVKWWENWRELPS